MSSVIISGASTGANIGMAVGTAVGKSLMPQADVHHSSQSKAFGLNISDFPNQGESTDSKETRSLSQELSRLKQYEKSLSCRHKKLDRWILSG